MLRFRLPLFAGLLAMSASVLIPLPLQAQEPLKPELVVQTGRSKGVSALAFSPDGSLLATADNDLLVRLWDAETRSLVRTFTGHTEPGVSLAFAPDGRTLASGTGWPTNQIKLWDVASGRELRTLPIDAYPNDMLVFSPDGRFLASGAGYTGREQKLWDVASGKELFTLVRDDSAPGLTVSFSPGGRAFLTQSLNGSALHIRDLKTSKAILPDVIKGPGGPRAIFSPDDRLLVLQSLSGETVAAWDVDAARPMEPPGATVLTSATHVAFSPDGKLVAGAVGGTIRLWDANTFQPQSVLPGRVERPVLLAFSPDGDVLAAADASGALSAWETRTVSAPRLLWSGMSGVAALAVAAGDNTIAVGDAQGNVRLWRFRTGEVHRLRLHPGLPLEFRFSPDGEVVEASAVQRGPIWDVKLWNCRSGKELFHLRKGKIGPLDMTEETPYSISPDWTRIANTGDARGADVVLSSILPPAELGILNRLLWRSDHPVTLSPDGKRAVIGCLGDLGPEGRTAAIGSIGEHTCRVWDLNSSAGPKTFGDSRENAYRAAFSRDGRLMVTWGPNPVWVGRTVQLRDPATGKTLRSLKLSDPQVNAWTLSQDGRTAAVNSFGRIIKVLEARTGKEKRALTAQGGVVALALDRDGSQLAARSDDGVVELWDLRTQKPPLVFETAQRGPGDLAFSPDGSLLAAADPASVHLWDGKALRTLLTKSFGGFEGLSFSPDGRFLAAGIWRGAVMWCVATGEEIRVFDGIDWRGLSAAFSPDGRTLAVGALSQIMLYDVATGRQRRSIRVPQEQAGRLGVQSVCFTPDGKVISAGCHYSYGPQFRSWNAATGKLLWSDLGELGGPVLPVFIAAGQLVTVGSVWRDRGLIRLWDGNSFRRLAALASRTHVLSLSPEGDIMASADGQSVVLWDVAARKQLRKLEGHVMDVTSLAVAPTGTLVAGGSLDGRVNLWQVHTGKLLRSVSHGGVWQLAFVPDGKMLASAGNDQTVKLWQVSGGVLVNTIATGQPSQNCMAISPDGKLIACGGADGAVRVWELPSGRELRTLHGFSGSVISIAFFPGGRKLITGHGEGAIGIWSLDRSDDRELCTLYVLPGGNWAVVDPDGRFDASNGGNLEAIHWVVGTEIIALSQLKERYYEPGLLPKLLGYSKEPLRDIEPFREVKLFPKVEVETPVPESTSVSVRLTNRGGGIGRVQAFLNDKEISYDARAEGTDSAASQATVTVNLPPSLISPGKENTLRVVAWNSEGYLSSRGTEIKWKPKGSALTGPPELFGIVVGVSDYTGNSIDLRFAASDAEAMAKALKLGAKRLFGVDRVHVRLLSTSGGAGIARPTMANLKKAFEDARKTRPQDILVVYLVGHGVKLPQAQDSYCFLTEEARSTDLSDPAVRSQCAVTSDDLVEWVNRVPAQKQVMVLDTCAAGAAALKLMAKRELSGEQIRAIDRLKDRTGFYVLMGCAADAGSYEATRYGQGVLTRAILQGMKGLGDALRDGQFVDVSRLFEYAADEVPRLAENLGGMQKPRIFRKSETASFDIGQMKPEDKAQVLLAKEKPYVLNAQLLNRELGVDGLDLNSLLNRVLKDSGSGGAAQPTLPKSYVYVPASAGELPGAIQPTGLYSVKGGKVQVVLVLSRDGKILRRTKVEGSTRALPALAVKMAEFIAGAAGGLSR